MYKSEGIACARYSGQVCAQYLPPWYRTVQTTEDGGQGTNELGEEQQEHETLGWFVFGNAPPLPQGLT